MAVVQARLVASAAVPPGAHACPRPPAQRQPARAATWLPAPGGGARPLAPPLRPRPKRLAVTQHRHVRIAGSWQDAAANFRFRFRVRWRKAAAAGRVGPGWEQGRCGCPSVGPHRRHGDAVPPALRRARVPQHQAEAAELGAHALGHDGLRAGGGVLLPHHRRDYLRRDCGTSQRGVDDRRTRAPEAGGLLGVQSKWTIYYGRACIQLPLHNGRLRIHNSGSIQCTKYPQAEQVSSALYWICERAFELLHGQSFHEDEITGLLDGLAPRVMYESLS